MASREEELVVAAVRSHALAGQPRLRLADLGDESFVDFHAGSGLQAVIERLCLEAGLHRRIALRVTQLDLLISLVRHGLGIAILPAPIAERADLARIPIAGTPPRRTVAVLTRAGRSHNPAARALLRNLHRVS